VFEELYNCGEELVGYRRAGLIDLVDAYPQDGSVSFLEFKKLYSALKRTAAMVAVSDQDRQDGQRGQGMSTHNALNLFLDTSGITEGVGQEDEGSARARTPSGGGAAAAAYLAEVAST
jgi:hypothetical protein